MSKFVFCALTLLIINFAAMGQQPTDETQSSPATEMADALRSEGKIYVVVLVVAILFTFFLGYLVVADRQLKKVEKEVEDLKSQNNKKE